MEMSEVIEISNSAIVDISYDGFLIKVNIYTNNQDVECACYLYQNKEVISKSGYNYNQHIFHVRGIEYDELKIKVFFRYKDNHIVKTTKVLPVPVVKNLRYEFSEKLFDDISLSNCEIMILKPTAIESYESIGFQPRVDNVPHKLALPIEWLEDPFNDRNWMFQLHAWRMLDAYLNRGEAKDLDYISQVINDWVGFEKNNKDKWLWYDMSTGLRALKIGYYLKKCSELNLDHQIEELDYLLHEHLKHLSNPKELNLGNHGLFQLHGLKILTYVVNSCDSGAYSMLDIKNYANDRMSKLITSQLGTCGVHTEDSPDYHFFTHKKITNIVNSPWWSDLDEDILQVLKLGEYAKPWLVFPDNRCVPIGDSANRIVKDEFVELEKWSHIKYDDYIAAKLDGYVVVRSLKRVPIEKSAFLFFQGAFHSQTHKHSDDLSLVLQEKGKDILIDSGKYGYKGDKYRRYFLSTRAHNTIEVDGKSTARANEHAYGSAIQDQPCCISGFWIVKGFVNHKDNGYTHKRIMVYKPGEELYIIDELENIDEKKSRNVSQWWHFDTDIKLDIRDVKAKAIAHVSLDNIIEISTMTSAKDVNLNLYKGYDSRNQLIGWVSKNYLKYEPTSTLKISTKLDNHLVILTRFKINNDLSDQAGLILKNEKVYTADKKLLAYLMT
ncbi:heparinase II/III-family protein [Psychrobacter sp. PAMC 21119]|uniref:heparinase II/III family protein n=1 Tax=Psychrobacter sp. PAMC 21119 TaxID=1112209 RepID=UPI000288ED0B|nr:heparinase II/III-family protein [Psychrobacter sp. PAMC 21119]